MLSGVLFQVLVTVRCFREVDALGVLFEGAGAGAFFCEIDGRVQGGMHFAVLLLLDAVWGAV